MKSFITTYKYTLAALVAVLLISLSTVVFGASKDSEEQAIAANAEECKLKAYTDPQKMAAAMANPAEFMQLMALMSQPQTYQNMMECGMDSSQWNEIIANMTNPASMMAASAQFMNPQMYMNWMTAMMNPAFYTAAMTPYMNPALYTQWMTASMNPAFYQAPMQAMDPKWQQEATTWMMDPANYQKMFEGFYNFAPVVADATPAK